MIHKQFASPDLYQLESTKAIRPGRLTHVCISMEPRSWGSDAGQLYILDHFGLALVLVEDQKSFMSLACKLRQSKVSAIAGITGSRGPDAILFLEAVLDSLTLSNASQCTHAAPLRGCLALS